MGTCQLLTLNNIVLLAYTTLLLYYCLHTFQQTEEMTGDNCMYSVWACAQCNVYSHTVQCVFTHGAMCVCCMCGNPFPITHTTHNYNTFLSSSSSIYTHTTWYTGSSTASVELHEVLICWLIGVYLFV